ncbi:MAG: hypothetical protein ACPLWD_05795 [Caldimicrobium thiodismutans]|jgi:flagellar biosynthesis protein FlhF
MRIKRFRAKNMMEALKKVKAELGEEAVILDSGKVTENGNSYYEVVAAIEEREDQLEPPSPSVQNFQELETADLESLKRDLLEIKKDIKLLLEKNKVKGEKYSYLFKEGVPEEIVQLLEEADKPIKDFLFEKLSQKGVCPFSKVQLFIGEPGVGKTTTIFKMAFWLRLKKNSKVMVLNSDNYKIGGKEQALRLSQLLEIPFSQIDWEDFEEKYKVFSKNFDYILIDTPSLGKKFSLYELTEIEQRFPFVRFHLVLRASENPKNLLNLWEEIKKLPIENITLTFLDKLYSGFSLFWILHPEFPFPSFASTGERIPEDFERLEYENFLRYLLKGTEKFLT